MYDVTGCIKLSGDISFIMKHITINIKKHLNKAYRAPREVSTNLTKPIVRSFWVNILIIQTIKYNNATVVTNAMIVTKKLAYAFEIMSASDLV